MAYSKKYRFGGLVFEVKSPVAMMERKVFEDFSCDSEADFIYEIYDRGSAENSGFPVETVREGNVIKAFMDVSLLPAISVANFLCSADAACLIREKKRFILHCSYVELNGEAILITAPSGTGKSTLAHHFSECLGACIVNEDRAIVYCENGRYYAAGCWAMGSADTCLNVTAPLRAVVILSQGKENKVSCLGAGEAISKIIPQCTFDEKSIAGRLSIIDEVSKLVEGARILSYSCINHPSAAYDLEGSI